MGKHWHWFWNGLLNFCWSSFAKVIDLSNINACTSLWLFCSLIALLYLFDFFSSCPFFLLLAYSNPFQSSSLIRTFDLIFICVVVLASYFIFLRSSTLFINLMKFLISSSYYSSSISFLVETLMYIPREFVYVFAINFSSHCHIATDTLIDIGVFRLCCT